MSKLIENRAAVKAAAREKDEGRLARGEISPQDLQKENSISRGFRRGLGFGPKDKPKSLVSFHDVSDSSSASVENEGAHCRDHEGPDQVKNSSHSSFET